MNLRTDIELSFICRNLIPSKYDGYNLKGSLIADLEGNTRG